MSEQEFTLDFDTFMDEVKGATREDTTPEPLPADAPEGVRWAEQVIGKSDPEFLKAGRILTVSFHKKYPNITVTECYMIASYVLAADVYKAFVGRNFTTIAAAKAAEAARQSVVAAGLSDQYRADRGLGLIG